MSEYNELDEIKYSRIGESKDADEKQHYWNIAFGLQAVDNLKPSKYMISLAKENIQGKKTYDVVDNDIKKYYSNQPEEKINKDEREADEVSIRIVKILNDKAFSFNIFTYKEYHKMLFYGVDIGINGRLIGEFRDYNITKDETILNGDTVQYSDYRTIESTLRYDFDEESKQKYSKMSDDEKVKRISEFTRRIWQVHPFGEGNTRTTAVFIQKYLISKGFDVNNELFKDNALYFRNALVRANYSNIQKGIDEDKSYLIAFFENLLLSKNNILDNNKLYIDKKRIDEKKKFNVDIDICDDV